jgi:hypothetical protein
MPNDLSHLLFKKLWNGFAACASIQTTLWDPARGPQAALESVKVAFSAAYRKATGMPVTLARTRMAL